MRIIDKMLKEIKEEEEREFIITEKYLKALEKIIEIAREEKWNLRYLIKELEVDIKIWMIRYKKGDA